MLENNKIYVAPMMQYTDKHDRYFLRLISKNVILFTEMIPTNAIINGNRKKLILMLGAQVKKWKMVSLELV